MASGSGSNAENIIDYLKNTNINCNFHIITNKKDAFVLERAKKMGVSAEIITKKENEEGVLRQRMLEINPDLIEDAQEDPEMLEDLIITAVNQAVNAATEESESAMSGMTAGLNIPGLF